MPEYRFRVTDDRGSAPSLFFVFAKNEGRARELAQHVLDESAQNVELEALDESGTRLFHISRRPKRYATSGG